MDWAVPHKLRALVAADRLVKCEPCGGLGWVPEGKPTVVFLVITWAEDEHEASGPYVAQPDGSHLDEIVEKAKAWRAEHPDREGMAVHLYAASAVPPGGSPDLETVP